VASGTGRNISQKFLKVDKGRRNVEVCQNFDLTRKGVHLPASEKKKKKTTKKKKKKKKKKKNTHKNQNKKKQKLGIKGDQENRLGGEKKPGGALVDIKGNSKRGNERRGEKGRAPWNQRKQTKHSVSQTMKNKRGGSDSEKTRTGTTESRGRENERHSGGTPNLEWLSKEVHRGEDGSKTETFGQGV